MFRLRELSKDDIFAINQWRNDPELISTLGAPFRYINLDVDNSWFENYMRTRSTAVRCAILDDEELIGLVSLVNIDHLNQSAIFNIMIHGGSNQNKGAGTFATKQILKHAFNNLNLHRIELGVLEYNERAIHMYEKVGFKKEGTKRKAIYKNGGFVDLHIYSILKEEFCDGNIDDKDL